jgi:hypothetical protein
VIVTRCRSAAADVPRERLNVADRRQAVISGCATVDIAIGGKPLRSMDVLDAAVS